ncbi:unnamed protein product [Clavelina lepadiformis]|uniref:Uncharacterized protein n=1 Tax=Clavelina lepadiformis TaxID=159417 RepID=A0ABP0FV74_CLALP
MYFSKKLCRNMVLLLPSLEIFGSEEQLTKWLSLACNFNITCSYAQTELSHGAFLRGLETTAIYAPKHQEIHYKLLKNFINEAMAWNTWVSIWH